MADGLVDSVFNVLSNRAKANELLRQGIPKNMNLQLQKEYIFRTGITALQHEKQIVAIPHFHSENSSISQM